MSLGSNKRRKTGHVASEDPEEDASFASFDEEDEELESTELVNAADGQVNSGDRNNVEDGSKGGKAKPHDGAVKADRNQARLKTSKSQDGLNNSAFTSGTFRSNIFKLQVDELLEQIRPRHGRREIAAEEALHSLKRTIEQIPARGPLLVEQAERTLLKEKVAIPFPNPRPAKDAKYKLEFAKPANINVVGSHPLKTQARSKEILVVDMVIQMPSSIFQEKDYLNHRYFYKRAFYLACVAAGLKASKSHHISFEHLHDNPLQPILVVKPSQGHEADADSKPTAKWQINILPSVAADVFAQEKLSLDRNCVRSATMQSTLDDDSKLAPTPLYNSTLRMEMLVTQYLSLLHQSATKCEAFKEACLLGSTWLQQRGISSGISEGGFGNFEWSALMGLLLQGGGPGGRPILSPGYSSYQLFKATLQLVAMRDLSKQPLIIGTGLEAPKVEGLPVVWDAKRGHNVLFRMMPWSFSVLRSEAKTTLKMLADQQFDGFNSTFILRINNPLLQNDALVDVPMQALPKDSQDQDAFQACEKLYDVLHRGLGDRASLIRMTIDHMGSWKVGSARPDLRSKRNIKVGFVVNSDTANRAVDHGPSADDKVAAAAFREFWGEKSELRRFKDGSILESLIWNTNEGGQSVIEQIVRHLLRLHFSPQLEETTQFMGEAFARMLRSGARSNIFSPLNEAYKKMENAIRTLEGLPLSIRQISPADPQLRSASIRAPADQSSADQASPANVIIQFEGSGRWPDELVAIQRTKIAFLLKLSELLQDAVDGVDARIGLENQDHDVYNQAFLDIMYDTGAAFRLRIFHDREQTLLEKQLKEKTLDPKGLEVAALALAKYKRDYVRAPLHTQAISQLCSRFSALSGSIRLTKKWFASHLLANLIAEEVIELLVVRTFVQPWPWQAPSSVQTGFLRTLHWLSRWDWRVEPLIVDLSGSGELKKPEVQAIKTRFEAWRKLDPGMSRVVCFAASNIDPDGTTYTDGTPSKVIAGRMTALAGASVVEFEQKALALEPASLFVSPLADYNFVLHLNPNMIGARRNRSSSNGTTFKNLELERAADTSLVGFNPASSLLQELESVYGSAILFFSGDKERTVIAGLWSPQTVERTWKVNLAYSTVPSQPTAEDNAMAVINKASILVEIAHLAGDLLERVEIMRS